MQFKYNSVFGDTLKLNNISHMGSYQPQVNIYSSLSLDVQSYARQLNILNYETTAFSVFSLGCLIRQDLVGSLLVRLPLM